MSLVKCPECGKEISDATNKCPNCGYPLIKGKIETVKKSINKKYMFISIGIVIIFAGLIFGIRCYTNTPEYVIKQYVKAINSKDLNKLDKITYKGNQFILADISDDDRINSYKITEKPTGDSERLKHFLEIHYKYPEKVDKKITKVATFSTYSQKKDFEYWITLSKVNGKWKIVDCPLFRYEDAL